jgi:hypothetical protein
LGRLESINSAHKTLVVKHGHIQGYAERGVGVYKVDDETVLGHLRPGDDISATVFPNDQTLYKIHVVYRRGQPRKAVKKTALFRDVAENRGSSGEALSALGHVRDGVAVLSIGNEQGLFVP